jgi:tetratricopeptide (TPR) repeat protein
MFRFHHSLPLLLITLLLGNALGQTAAPPLAPAAVAAIAAGEALMAEALATYPAQYPDRPLWQRAFAEGRRAVALSPERSEPLRFLAEAYSRSNWTGRAWQAWVDFASLGGDFDEEARELVAGVGKELGYGAYTRGDLDLALTYYQQVVAWAPLDIETRVWVARIYTDQERPLDAIDAWTTVVELDPTDARAQYFLELSREQARWGTATVTVFREGVTLYEQGLLSLAAERFERAASLNPRYAAAWAWLGRVSYERFDYTSASRAYANAVGLEPDNETYRYFLNQAISRSNN